MASVFPSITECYFFHYLPKPCCEVSGVTGSRLKPKAETVLGSGPSYWCNLPEEIKALKSMNYFQGPSYSNVLRWVSATRDNHEHSNSHLRCTLRDPRGGFKPGTMLPEHWVPTPWPLTGVQFQPTQETLCMGTGAAIKVLKVWNSTSRDLPEVRNPSELYLFWRVLLKVLVVEAKYYGAHMKNQHYISWNVLTFFPGPELLRVGV